MTESVPLPSYSAAPTGPVPTTVSEPSPPPSPEKGEVVLEIKDLRTYFFTYDGIVRALDGVFLKVRRGETTGLVGETGCGKSVTAFSVTRLVSDPPGRVMGGEVLYRGANLLWGVEREASVKISKRTNRAKVRRHFGRIQAAVDRMAAVRGRGIAMIFQEPSQAMNPVFSIESHLGEVLMLHRGRPILDEMLAATPEAPGVPEAIDALVAARQRREGTRAAARRLGELVGSERVATEAYHLARTRNPPDVKRLEIAHALRRMRLSPVIRQYLTHRRRLLELSEELHSVYLAEMREGRERPGARRANRLRAFVERATHFYFGLWGIRGWVVRPLNHELFWRSVRLLEGVSIANPVQVARGYPHELSGGMLQRVMIAMALSSDPDVLIADEPTTALDVTIQAQILDLMEGLRTRVGTAILLITHDLAVIAEVADRVCVMYAGQIVEEGRVRDLFRQPLHPYTQGLLASIPRVDQPEKKLSSIPGSVPNLIDPPSGCRFHPRCAFAMPVCRESRPPTTVEGPDHTVACYLYKGPSVGE